MRWWRWALLAWLVFSVPLGVLVGWVIRAGQGGHPCDGCGHGREAHERYRPGSDCELCA